MSKELTGSKVIVGSKVFVVATMIAALTACTGAGAPPATASDATPAVKGADRSLPTPSRPETPIPSPPSSPSTVGALPQLSTEGCITNPGSLQALIDATPDGSRVADMKGKLVNASALGFSVLDLSDECYENQGTITLNGRYGIWIVRPTTTGSDWEVVDTTDTVLSGIVLNGGSLKITSGNQRLEAGEIHNLSVADVTDFMMGKMTVTGHAVFDSLRRVDTDKSFVRNSEFNTMELIGDFEGFKIENSTAVSLINNTDSSTNLDLRGLTIR